MRQNRGEPPADSVSPFGGTWSALRDPLGIARFVLEGDDDVAKLVRDAEGRAVLEGRTFVEAVEGGVEGRRRAVAALYEELRSRAYTYAYERDFDPTTGEQKIRFPQQIVSETRATCVDVVALFLSAVAQIKLDPFYVHITSQQGGGQQAELEVGHALAAVWLGETTEVADITADLRTAGRLPETRPALIDPSTFVRLRNAGEPQATSKLLVLDVSYALEGYPPEPDGRATEAPVPAPPHPVDRVGEAGGGEDATLALGETGAVQALDGEEWQVEFAVDARATWELPGYRPHRPFPRVWMTPARNRYFVGREGVLADVRSKLNSVNAVALSQAQALSGLGGIGKTQTAIEFAYRNRGDYDAVLWANASSRLSLTSSFITMAQDLDLPEKDDQDPGEIARAVLRWLTGRRRWLVVFDNADDPDVLLSLLPRRPFGHVLVCSRAQVFQSLGILQPIEIGKMEPAEALEFLLGRTGRETSTKGAERTAAEELARELGYLPLALEQAAAFIVEHSSPFASYVQSYRTRRQEHLDEARPQEGDYDETVATTWLMNFEAVLLESEAAADLLKASSFFAPDSIPVELLVEGSPSLGPAVRQALREGRRDPVLADRQLRVLDRYSLIRRDLNTNTYGVHRLVQAVVRDRLDEDDVACWAIRAVGSVHRLVGDATGRAGWARWQRIVQHAEAASSRAIDAGFEGVQVRDLVFNVGSYLATRGQYERASPLFLRALELTKVRCGQKSTEFGRTLGEVGVLYGRRGQFVTATRLLERATSILADLEAEEARTEKTYYEAQLAWFNWRLGRREAAERSFRSSLGTYLDREEPERLVWTLNAVARMLLSDGRWELARNCITEASSAESDDMPPALLATTEANRARLLLASVGNPDASILAEGPRPLGAAEETARRALELLGGVDEDSITDDTARCLCLLGAIHREMDRFEVAERELRDALDIHARTTGLDHPDAAVAQEDLAGMLLDGWRGPELGQAEALQLMRQAHRTSLRALGRDHDRVTRLEKLVIELEKAGTAL